MMIQCCCCSIIQSCPTLCDSMDCSSRSFPVLHHPPEFAPVHGHWVGDAIQPSHLLSSPSPPAFNLSQHQGLFQRVDSLHQVAKVLKLQLQHESSQWIFRVHVYVFFKWYLNAWMNKWLKQWRAPGCARYTELI